MKTEMNCFLVSMLFLNFSLFSNETDTKIENNDRFGQVIAIGDFNCDQHDDLFVSGIAKSNKITIDYLIGQNSGGLQSYKSFIYNYSGTNSFTPSLILGDFNHDGCDDLVIGAAGSDSSKGSVIVSYGNISFGEQKNNQETQIWTQNSPGIAGSSENGDKFGSSVAVGDINGDGYDDLLIGVPGESLAVNGITYKNTGAVHLFYGSSTGLNGKSEFISFDGKNLENWNQNYQQFGYTISAGDLDGDQFDEIIIGIPYRDNGSSLIDSGEVLILHGYEKGINYSRPHTYVSFDYEGVYSMAGDLFGFALAVGDFNHDHVSDMAIGSPGHKNKSGEVLMLLGNKNGNMSNSSMYINQNLNFIPGINETGDMFGYSLSIGDVVGDGYDDLIIGVPGEDIDNFIDAGAVIIISGTNSGLDTSNVAHALNQDNPSSMEGEKNSGDQFGYRVLSGKLNNDSKKDIVIGVPCEDVVTPYQHMGSNELITYTDAGSINVVYNSMQTSFYMNELWTRNY